MRSRNKAYDEEYKLTDDSEKDSKRVLTGFGLFFHVLAFVGFFMYMVAYQRPVIGHSLAKIDYYIFLLDTIPAFVAYLIEATWAVIKEQSTFRVIKFVLVTMAATMFSWGLFQEMYIVALRWNVVSIAVFVLECISLYRYKTYREIE